MANSWRTLTPLAAIPLALASTGFGSEAPAAKPSQPPMRLGKGSATPVPAAVQTAMRRLGLYFIENRGQLDGRVSFYLQGQTATYFTGEGITFSFTKPPPPPPSRFPRPGGEPTPGPVKMKSKEELPEPSPTPEAKRWAVAIDLVGARRPLWPEGADVLPTIVSYFKGPEDQWKTALATYQTVLYRDVWPAIDLEYTVKPGQMKYTYIVRPGGDPQAIRLRYRGAAKVKVEDGELMVETPLGGIRDQRPVAFQEVDGCREEVTARHVLRKQGADYIASFKVGAYDRNSPLMIDPVVLALPAKR